MTTVKILGVDGLIIVEASILKEYFKKLKLNERKSKTFKIIRFFFKRLNIEKGKGDRKKTR